MSDPMNDPLSAIVIEAVGILDPKVKGVLKGTARLMIIDHGAIFLSAEGARADPEPEGPADVTMTASEAVFRGILNGKTNPIVAAMTGRLKMEGSTTRALKIGEIMTS